jgi:hypothetical protein
LNETTAVQFVLYMVSWRRLSINDGQARLGQEYEVHPGDDSRGVKTGTRKPTPQMQHFRHASIISW